MFVSFNIAKLLKELNYNEPCIACYSFDETDSLLTLYSKDLDTIKNSDIKINGLITAPSNEDLLKYILSYSAKKSVLPIISTKKVTKLTWLNFWYKILRNENWYLLPLLSVNIKLFIKSKKYA